MVGGKSTVEIIIAAKDRTKAAFAKVNTQMQTMKGGAGRLTGSLGNLTGGVGKLVGALGPLGLAAAAAAAAVAVVSLGVVAVKSFAEFEDAMANVRKTTGFTKESIKVLGDAINEMALNIPVAQTELADIAAIAGQLGIQGKDNILSFTEDVAKMSTAFDMSAESAATAMAKMSNIYDIPIEQASSLGSAINVLGNTTAAQESAIMNFSMSLGASANQLGFTATEAVSMGASLISMGMDASDSGTRLNAAFTAMGKKVGEVASFLDLTEAEFKTAFGADPMAMMTNIIGKLSQIKDPLERNTSAAELFGAIGAKAINGLGGNLEGLQTNLANAAEGFEANTSLSEEFAAKTDTLNAKFALFGNAMESFKINIGEALAPLAGALVDTAGAAIKGLSAAFSSLQTVVGAVMAVIKTFHDAIMSAVSSALAPLAERIEALQQKFKEGSERLTLFSDVFTIVSAAAKWLGEAIGTLVSMALTPLVAKLREGMDMLGAFYDKLGPIKGALEWVGESVHNVAESFRETKPPIEEVEKALEKLAEEGPKAPTAIADAWAIAVKAFQDGAGTYKDAVAGINKEVEALKEEWKTATDERKTQIDKAIILIHEQTKAVEALEKGYNDHFASLIDQTDNAIEKTKEFIVTIGDTTIEFKGAAAEVVKNADAYEKLQKSAQTLIDLDWAVFTEFEASLPRIDAGLGDMESSFAGLKGVLEDNIEELEHIKQSVIDVSGIAAPFLEKGFLEGIKAIGSFASALKDAGSAINDFSSLQDVSIDGMINFSMHVQDMVSALQILESQMEDLVPVFGNMDSLISDVVGHFIWTGGRKETLVEELNRVATSQRQARQELDAGLITWEEYIAHMKEAGNVTGAMQDISSASFAVIFDYYTRYITGTEDVNEITKDFLDTSGVAEKQMDKQTNALKFQTDQLNKITEALQPYLEFMRTLNELAALSTFSTVQLNSGLTAITDTITNLGKALTTFDLESAMASLFNPPEVAEIGGAAWGFMDTMAKHESNFALLTGRVLNLTGSVLSLVSAFDALAGIGDSVLADQTKLKQVFEDITKVMTNFSAEMGGTEGFAQKFATGMDAMLKSADPLISYFQDNNAAVTQFNTALLSFKTTITTVIDVFDTLASVIKRSSDLVVISAKDIEDALSLVDDQLIEIGKYLQTAAWSEMVTQLSAVSKEWEKWASNVDNSMPAFNGAVDTFSTLISKILGLSSALKDMRDMTVLSVRDIDEALKNIPIFLDRFVDALALNMGAIKQSLKELDKEWALHRDEMDATMPSYEDSTSQIGKLVGSLLSLHSALESLSEIGTISERAFDKGFKSLMTSISNFAVSLSNNVDDLIYSLQKLRVVWMENEAVLFPLIYDFAIITDNLWGVAHNANRMAEEFSNISKNSKTLEKGFESLIKFINQVIKGTKEFYTTEAAAELATFIEDVSKVIDAFVDLERELGSAMGKIKRAISTAVDNIGGTLSGLSNLVRSAYYWGANIMGGFITGIDSMSNALESAVARQALIVEDYLGAASPTRLGPLSNLDEWPRNLIQSYSSGIEAEMHTLNSSFAGLSPGMDVGSAGRNKNVNFYVTQHISDRATANYANRDLERLMHKHAVM